MKSLRRKLWLLLGAGTMAVAISAALWGCKEHPSADGPESLPPTPVLHAAPVATNLLADPLTDSAWQKASWSRLVSPLNDTRSAPPTQVACAYDASNLYVAFICTNADAYTGEPGGMPWEHDSVELWIDTASAPKLGETGTGVVPRAVGCEMFRIIATPQGEAFAYWYRSAEPPKPKEDGSPDFAHPITMNPVALSRVPGLKVKTGAGQLDGQPEWSAVIALPLASLPVEFRAKPEVGAHWHANLIRNDWIKTQDGKRELLQSNFSPVYSSAQAVSPYRMADLLLDGDSTPVLTLHAGN